MGKHTLCEHEWRVHDDLLICRHCLRYEDEIEAEAHARRFFPQGPFVEMNRTVSLLDNLTVRAE